MPSIILDEIEKMILDISKFGELDSKINEFYRSMGQTPHENQTQLETIVIFDLVESTLLKLKIGHAEAMRKILLHDKICRAVVKRLDGEILKETGDGLVTLFENPLNACLAAINVLEIAIRKEIPTKAVLALGMVEKIKLSNKIDIFGTSMDVCSRIEKYAIENQILINSSLHDTAITFLKNYDDILISKPITVTLKGYGKTEIYEIASKHVGLKNHIKSQLHIEDRQLSTDEKIELIQNAKLDITEIGEGFQDIANHLENSVAFGDFVKGLLKKGINVKFIMAEPDWNLEKTMGESEQEDVTISRNHFTILKVLQSELRNEKFPGMLEIYLYEKSPSFSATCIDSNQDDVMIIVSNHLNGIAKSKTPQIQISKTSQPSMFNSYMSSIKFLITNSKLQ